MAAPSANPTRTVHAVCTHDCPDSCGILVTVDTLTGRATRLQGDPAHPVTRGFLCGKVARYLDRVYAPDRLLYPMRRKPGVPKGPLPQGQEADAFERISWDDALVTIAARFQQISAVHGPESILPYSYAGTIGQLGYGSMDRRFFHRLGALQLDRTICATAGGFALKSVYGVKLGTPPQDFVHAGLILAWGANIHGNNIHLWPFIEEARRGSPGRPGAKLVVIDPYRTRTAALADQHLAIRPGTDALLALSLLHVIASEGLEDTAYLDACTTGWPELRAHALLPRHAPERAAEITGIPATTIIQLARDYALAGRNGRAPAVIRVNYGIQRAENGGTAARAVCMLPLVTGSWQQRGGGLLLSTSGSFPFNERALHQPELAAASPLGRPARTVNMSELGNLLTASEHNIHAPNPFSSFAAVQTLSSTPTPQPLSSFATPQTLSSFAAGGESASPSSGNSSPAPSTPTPQTLSSFAAGGGSASPPPPPIHALFVYNCNPAAVAPDATRVLAGLRRPDLFTVVHEQFFTDTTDYADILLPATTFLEHKELMGAYGHLFAQISEPAIAPLGEARSNPVMFAALARAMGFTEPAFTARPEDTEDHLVAQALDTAHPWFARDTPHGITPETLATHKHLPLALPGNALPFSDATWFQTPSGRGELTPVPVYVAPTESRSQPAASTYPLEFLPRKADNFMNSTFANLPTHQHMERRSAGVLEMHPTDAAARSLVTGDSVTVYNDRGRIELLAHVNGSVAPGVVAARLDWHKLSAHGANVNTLTSQRLTDLGAGATFYSTLVEVRRLLMTEQ